MSDLIRVCDLEVWAHIGVPDAERSAIQKLLVTLEMQVTGFANAAARDDIAKTVDYFKVAQRVKSFVAERPRKLLETLAEEIASDLLRTFAILKITLEIKKFILPDAHYVSVKVERVKGG
jgi:dihydroneopterin aldolase